jgi:hypothetical protein
MAKIDALVLNCDNVQQPGTQNRFYVRPILAGMTFPNTQNQATPNATTNEGEAIIAAAFAYVDGQDFWRESPIFMQTGNIKSAATGEASNGGFTNTFTGKWMDDAPAIRGFIQRLKNMEKCFGFLVAVPQPDGSFAVVGDVINPARLTEGTTQSGDKVGGEGRESSFTIGNDGKIFYNYPSTLTALRVAPVV